MAKKESDHWVLTKLLDVQEEMGILIEGFESEPDDAAGEWLTVIFVEVFLLTKSSASEDSLQRFLSDFSLGSSRGIEGGEEECSRVEKTMDCEPGAMSVIMTSSVNSSEFTRSNRSKSSNAMDGRRGRGRE